MPRHTKYQKTQKLHKINTKKLKPGLIASYDIRRGNGVGLFLSQHFTYLLT